MEEDNVTFRFVSNDMTAWYAAAVVGIALLAIPSRKSAIATSVPV
jgi:hypothetical protein